jgi:hypothetical protein
MFGGVPTVFKEYLRFLLTDWTPFSVSVVNDHIFEPRRMIDEPASSAPVARIRVAFVPYHHLIIAFCASQSVARCHCFPPVSDLAVKCPFSTLRAGLPFQKCSLHHLLAGAPPALKRVARRVNPCDAPAGKAEMLGRVPLLLKQTPKLQVVERGTSFVLNLQNNLLYKLIRGVVPAFPAPVIQS